ncbi:DNA cytosine methyltransferase [Nocardia rhizosphaerihabitans]|uniref:DNA cytosine methyltransferase n=1 Tax=Nocardia rhizosphaerihabitans TaxID=1691570 RepID=UPI0036724D65
MREASRRIRSGKDRSSLTLTATDLFCGAGGSSTGLHDIPGMSVSIAANHWQLAIDSHGMNHPNTDHKCADISQVDPRLFPRTDVLWASPECTNHSQASGRKRNFGEPDENGDVLPDEAAQRSRATMWDVPRFAERHQYRAIITENVVDAAKWVMFPAWLNAMDLLGYAHRIVYLNSMHAGAAGLPAPQSRDRMYVVFWRKGDRAPDIEKWTRPRAWCSRCEKEVLAVQSFKKAGTPWGRYRAQYVYRCPDFRCKQVVEPAWLPASSAIDWTIQGQRIGDRPKPLSEKTMGRIRTGLDRYYGESAILVPVEGRDNKQPMPGSSPLRTMTTRNETGLLVPNAFVVPLRANNTVKPVGDPFDTFAASGNHHGIAEISSVPSVDDCTFRMLQPHEIAGGMAFPSGYRILGTKREQVRQAGNAVTPPAARDLGSAVAEALGHEIAMAA